MNEKGVLKFFSEIRRFLNPQSIRSDDIYTDEFIYPGLLPVMFNLQFGSLAA